MLIDTLAGKLLVGLFMLLCAALDFRENKIDIRVFLGMLFAEICGYFGMIFYGMRIDYTAIALGAGCGFVLWILSRITDGALGPGDAIFFGLTGLAMGGELNLLLIAGAIGVSAVFGLTLSVKAMLRGSTFRNRSFALLPLVLPVGLLILILR